MEIGGSFLMIGPASRTRVWMGLGIGEAIFGGMYAEVVNDGIFGRWRGFIFLPGCCGR